MERRGKGPMEEMNITAMYDPEHPLRLFLSV